MSPILKTAAAAAFTGAALFAWTPAEADEFSVHIGVPGVAFSYESGGFCDRWGCPGDYWDYPVYYGPVFYDGAWFDGPVYYRVIGDEHIYWVHGGWHRDEWRGPHPGWWGHYRYGPALGYTFYEGHGFHHGRDPFWHGDHWDNGRHRGWDKHDGERVRFDDGGNGRHGGDRDFPRDDEGGHGHHGDHGGDHGGGHGHGHGHGG